MEEEEEALGYKQKSKSQRDILWSTRDKVDLIFFDDEPVTIDNTGSMQLSTETPSSSSLQVSKEASKSCTNDAPHIQTTVSSTPGGYPQIEAAEGSAAEEGPHRAAGAHQIGSNADSKCSSSPGKKTAKSRLFEICAAKHWKPPSFVLFEEERPSHQMMFTYKVTIIVDTITTTVLECFSEPKPEKNEAQEHAAEGALWYLKLFGYLPEP